MLHNMNMTTFLTHIHVLKCTYLICLVWLFNLLNYDDKSIIISGLLMSNNIITTLIY